MFDLENLFSYISRICFILVCHIFGIFASKAEGIKIPFVYKQRIVWVGVGVDKYSEVGVTVALFAAQKKNK